MRFVRKGRLGEGEKVSLVERVVLIRILFFGYRFSLDWVLVG